MYRLSHSTPKHPHQLFFKSRWASLHKTKVWRDFILEAAGSRVPLARVHREWCLEGVVILWADWGVVSVQLWHRWGLIQADTEYQEGCTRKPQWGTAEPGWDVRRANQQNSRDRTSPDDSCRHGHSSSVYPKSQTGYLKCICHIVWFVSDRLTSQFEKCQLGFILVHVVRFRGEILYYIFFGTTSSFVFVFEYVGAKTLLDFVVVRVQLPVLPIQISFS